MKRILLLFAIVMVSLLNATSSHAQIINTTIRDIQTVVAQDLAACIDTPRYVNKRVRIKGVVINRGGIAQTQSVGNRQLWIREASSYSGPFTAIGLRATANQPNKGVDLLSLEEGDSVEVVGTVGEFVGSQDAETQINVSPNSPDSVAILGTVAKPQAQIIQVSDIMDQNRLNKLPTGEQYEGEFVGVRGVTVTEVQTFTSGGETRVSFWVRDQAGNQVNITDRFAAQRPRLGFRAPSVGDFFDTLMGIIIHNRNGCPGSPATNRGYQISPFDSTHYKYGPSAPGIFAITRNPVCPPSTQAVTITATFTNGYAAGGVRPTLNNPQLFYATGTTGGQYTAVPFTNTSGTTWTATIPAQANGTFVRYYIQASNSINLTNNTPNVPGNANPLFYTVNDAGCTIRDVQFTPYITGTGASANGVSGYVGQIVTVEGVVTSDTSDNRAFNGSTVPSIWIQQEGALAWGAINVQNPSNSVSALRRGDKVRIQGTVAEFNQITQLQGTITATLVPGGGTITPLTLSPSTIATYANGQNEQYEGMVVKVEGTTTPLAVIDTNYLITPVAGRNFGEWRVGFDPSNPTDGALVLTGSATTTSKKVGYINRLAFSRGLLTAPILVDLNTRFSSVQGILTQTFGDVKLLPRDNADFTGYTVGLGSAIKGASFNLYPNPASQVVNLTSASDLAGATAQILDVTGRMVSTQSVNGGQISINNLNAGLYQVRVVDAKGANLGTTKLVVR